MASNGRPSATAYDAAIAVATAAEKERLQALRLRFNIPADSPEWQFYAILAPVVEAGRADTTDKKTLAAFAEQLDRIESMKPGADLTTRLVRIEELVRANGKRTADPIVAGPTRYVFACLVGVLLSIALAAFVNDQRIMPSSVTLTAGVAIGLAIGLGYQLVAAMARVRP